MVDGMQSRRGAEGRRAGALPRRPTAAGASPERPPWLGLGRANAALLAAGVLSIVAGYVLLDRGSITAAPALLILGYVVLIPAGLVVGLRRGKPPPE